MPAVGPSPKRAVGKIHPGSSSKAFDLAWLGKSRNRLTHEELGTGDPRKRNDGLRGVCRISRAQTNAAAGTYLGFARLGQR